MSRAIPQKSEWSWAVPSGINAAGPLTGDPQVLAVLSARVACQTLIQDAYAVWDEKEQNLSLHAAS